MKSLLACAAGLAIATLGLAQPPAPPPGGGMPPIKRAEVAGKVARYFAEIDANKDGAITEAEIRAARRERMKAMIKAHRDHEFAMLDTDRNGSLSRQEFDSPPPPPGKGDGPPPGMGPDGPHGRGRSGPHGPGGFGPMPMGRHWFETADANQDGKVTLAEAQTAALAAFDKADANHDGVLDGEEMRARFMARRGPHGPGGDMPPPPRAD